MGKTYTFSTQAVDSLNDLNKATINVMDTTTTKSLTGPVQIPADGTRQSVSFIGPTDSSYYPLKVLVYNGEAGWRSQNNPKTYNVGDWNDTNYYYNSLYEGKYSGYHGSRPYGDNLPNPDIYTPIEDAKSIAGTYKNFPLLTLIQVG